MIKYIVDIIERGAYEAGRFSLLITEASQLKGKRFATVIGTTAHNLMDKYLASGGLTDEDIKFVNVNSGDIANVLQYGGADAAATWEPSVTRLDDSGAARILGEGSDCGLKGTNTLIARRDFAYKNPELVRIINEQYLRGAAALEEGLDKETAERIAEYMKLDEEQIDKLLPKFKYTVDVTQEDIDSLNDTIGFLYKEKQIPEVYDISEYIAGQK